MRALPPLSEMHRAVEARDASYDAVFVVAIRTTGIFCRPSCPARPALPRNREFFPGPEQADQAGFRPCRRCRPWDATGRPPPWIAPLLADLERDPGCRMTDNALRRRGLDPTRVRRWFRRHHGMTFQAYCRGRRMGIAMDKLRQGTTLDEVALDHGYDSHSGFREAFTRTFGKPPGRARQMGQIVVDWVESPVGPLVLGATDDAVCLLEFASPERLGVQTEALRRHFERAVVPGRNEILEQLRQELKDYFQRQRQKFTVPLVYPGTEFQNRVWSALLDIPYGQTCSYKDVAQAIGSPQATRAVGRCNGQNRIALVIPCHRVVNHDGKLGGYGGELWRKQFLLDLERQGQG